MSGSTRSRDPILPLLRKPLDGLNLNSKSFGGFISNTYAWNASGDQLLIYSLTTNNELCELVLKCRFSKMIELLSREDRILGSNGATEYDSASLQCSITTACEIQLNSQSFLLVSIASRSDSFNNSSNSSLNANNSSHSGSGKFARKQWLSLINPRTSSSSSFFTIEINGEEITTLYKIASFSNSASQQFQSFRNRLHFEACIAIGTASGRSLLLCLPKDIQNARTVKTSDFGPLSQDRAIHILRLSESKYKTHTPVRSILFLERTTTLVVGYDSGNVEMFSLGENSRSIHAFSAHRNIPVVHLAYQQLPHDNVCQLWIGQGSSPLTPKDDHHHSAFLALFTFMFESPTSGGLDMIGDLSRNQPARFISIVPLADWEKTSEGTAEQTSIEEVGFKFCAIVWQQLETISSEPHLTMMLFDCKDLSHKIFNQPWRMNVASVVPDNQLILNLTIDPQSIVVSKVSQLLASVDDDLDQRDDKIDFAMSVSFDSIFLLNDGVCSASFLSDQDRLLDSFEHVELFGATSQPGIATIDFKTKVIDDLQRNLIAAGLLSSQQIPSQHITVYRLLDVAFENGLSYVLARYRHPLVLEWARNMLGRLKETLVYCLRMESSNAKKLSTLVVRFADLHSIFDDFLNSDMPTTQLGREALTQNLCHIQVLAQSVELAIWFASVRPKLQAQAATVQSKLVKKFSDVRTFHNQLNQTCQKTFDLRLDDEMAKQYPLFADRILRQMQQHIKVNTPEKNKFVPLFASDSLDFNSNIMKLIEYNECDDFEHLDMFVSAKTWLILYKLIGLVEALPSVEDEIRKYCNSFHVNFETQLGIRFLYHLDTISEVSSLSYVHQIGVELQNGRMRAEWVEYVLTVLVGYALFHRSHFETKQIFSDCLSLLRSFPRESIPQTYNLSILELVILLECGLAEEAFNLQRNLNGKHELFEKMLKFAFTEPNGATRTDMVKFLFGCPLSESEEEKLHHYLTHTFEKTSKGYRLLFAYYVQHNDLEKAQQLHTQIKTKLSEPTKRRKLDFDISNKSNDRMEIDKNESSEDFADVADLQDAMNAIAQKLVQIDHSVYSGTEILKQMRASQAKERQIQQQQIFDQAAKQPQTQTQQQTSKQPSLLFPSTSTSIVQPTPKSISGSSLFKRLLSFQKSPVENKQKEEDIPMGARTPKAASSDTPKKSALKSSISKSGKKVQFNKESKNSSFSPELTHRADMQVQQTLFADPPTTRQEEASPPSSPSSNSISSGSENAPSKKKQAQFQIQLPQQTQTQPKQTQEQQTQEMEVDEQPQQQQQSQAPTQIQTQTQQQQLDNEISFDLPHDGEEEESGDFVSTSESEREIEKKVEHTFSQSPSHSDLDRTKSTKHQQQQQQQQQISQSTLFAPSTNSTSNINPIVEPQQPQKEKEEEQQNKQEKERKLKEQQKEREREREDEEKTNSNINNENENNNNNNNDEDDEPFVFSPRKSVRLQEKRQTAIPAQIEKKLSPTARFPPTPNRRIKQASSTNAALNATPTHRMSLRSTTKQTSSTKK